MINPNSLKVGYEKTRHHSLPGGKGYFPIVGRRCLRGRFALKTATEAETYAKKVHQVWVRLYDQAIRLQVAAEVTEGVAIDAEYAAVIENADMPTEEAKG